jgi:pimeloyl-ACP methyl ester carboxylesterase
VAVAYEETECFLSVPVQREVECGYLTVPEDRSDPQSGPIRLYVAVFKASSANPAPDPVVYLAGGPGEHASETIPLALGGLTGAGPSLEAFLTNRDFIVLDQRGAGASEPALDCWEVFDATYDAVEQELTPDDARERARNAALACRERLANGEGIDLTSYTSVESAADLNDLRQALRYEEWNLYGVSYGTRLALTVMRDHPEGIRSVVLDSAYPLQVDLYAGILPNFDRALQALFQACAADAQCGANYPNLETVFWEVYEQLNETPIVISSSTLLTTPLEEGIAIPVTGDDFLGFIHQGLYSSEIIRALPEMVYDARNGETSTLGALYASALLSLDYISYGMHYSVQCAEEAPFTTAEIIAAAAEDYPRLQPLLEDLGSSGSLLPICTAWGAGEPASTENEPVRSAIPTLVLAGGFDPITPPAWGELAAQGLENSYYLELPAGSHGTSLSAMCPASIVEAFLASPTTRPDDSCIAAEMQAITFVVPPEQETLIPFTSEAFGIQGVAPEGWLSIDAVGVHARSALNDVSLMQQSSVGLSVDQMLSFLAGTMGLEETPESTGTREANGLTWTLYEGGFGGKAMDMALTADVGGRVHLVVMASPASKRDAYYEHVFLPAVDALRLAE